jgi:hypothetical protein
MNDFNGQPFSSLEPEILCRLVYVRSVECLGGGGEPAAAAAAAERLGAAEAPGDGGGGAVADEAGEGGGGGGGKKDGKGGGTAAAAAAAGAAGGRGVLEPMAGHTELPTCPVCLERLDEHISGVVTTVGGAMALRDGGSSTRQRSSQLAAASVPAAARPSRPSPRSARPSLLQRPRNTQVCNHQFHGECLKAWGDTSCPVCRYCTYGGDASAGTSRCATCGTGANLWICLICGHVGCGRYRSGHASEHWKASSHCYALELETQRVWDYAGAAPRARAGAAGARYQGGGASRPRQGFGGAQVAAGTRAAGLQPRALSLTGLADPPACPLRAPAAPRRRLRAPPNPVQDRRQAGRGALPRARVRPPPAPPRQHAVRQQRLRRGAGAGRRRRRRERRRLRGVRA